MTSKLPIYEIIPKLKKDMSQNNNLVLQAPPGAGKTTVVPLALLNEKWLDGRKIIMLEPRRLAARASAKRMADILGEKVGETVGYRVRLESKIGPTTRIEVVTERVLIRIIQNDPELAGVNLIIFDEFHERSADADLGLSLSLDIQQVLREDLKIVVMSATLDGEKIAALMDNAPIISSVGRQFDIDYRYLEKPMTGRIEDNITTIIRKTLSEERGSILVFLPGAGEIERTKTLLENMDLGPEVIICPLYGMMQFKEQDLAIKPSEKDRRKIVLSTAIAETSLTIEGIRIVIDSGLQRNALYDSRSGMTRLVTSSVSRASADQRAGRAGRTEEGVCYRMWSMAANRSLAPFTIPEIKKTDLAPLALDLANWGVSKFSEIKWLDKPDPKSFEQAKALLFSLGAIDVKERITDHGKKMATFPMHPRLAHMILLADQFGQGELALTIAALLAERELLNLNQDQKTADLRLRIETLEDVKKDDLISARKLGCNIGAARNILKQINVWRKDHQISQGAIQVEKAGLCLAIAYPDRIAALRASDTRSYLLSNGRGAKLTQDDPLGSEKYLAIGDLDKGQRDARIFMAAPISKTEIEIYFKHIIREKQEILWNDKDESVKTNIKIMLDKIPLSVSKIKDFDKDEVTRQLLVGIRRMGLGALNWKKKSDLFRKRANLINAYIEDCLPSLTDDALLDNLDIWLGPYLGGILSIASVRKLDCNSILMNIMNREQIILMDKLAPLYCQVPSGSSTAIDYDTDPPTLSVKLQEMFGANKTPAILDGRVKLRIHLLSPARRPLQITEDLAGFWDNSYPEIRKEMKGRYPKHPWPDDPHRALPTKKLKPKNK